MKFYFTSRYKFISYRQNHWYEFCIKYNLGFIYKEIEYKTSLYFSCYFFEIKIDLPYKHFSFKNIELTKEEEINNNRYIILSEILNKKINLYSPKRIHFLPISYGIQIVKTTTGQKCFVFYFGKDKEYQNQKEIYFKIGKKSDDILIKFFVDKRLHEPKSNSEKNNTYIAGLNKYVY